MSELPPDLTDQDLEPLNGGKTHAEVLAMELPEERYLVDGLIPVGAVGTIAGLPETHKSFLAQALAVRVAAGTGTVLGYEVTRQANVAYLWQDDSTRSEIARIQLYETVHKTEDELPLRWYLNTGVSLPRDIYRLKMTVLVEEIELLILDSFYNFAALDLKDSDAELLVALLKHQISDPTGATVVFVDHMPWPTDGNRSRLRTYGGVFKSAATRFGIYLDAVGKKLWIEARGNNIEGFDRTLAEWNKDKLEIELIQPKEPLEDIDETDYENRILTFLETTPNASSKELEESVEGRKKTIMAVRKKLLENGRIKREKNGRDVIWNIADPSLLDEYGSDTVPKGREPVPEKPGTEWEPNPPKPIEQDNEAEKNGSQRSGTESNQNSSGTADDGSDILSTLRVERSNAEPRHRPTDTSGRNDETYRGDDDIPF